MKGKKKSWLQREKMKVSLDHKWKSNYASQKWF